MLLEPIITQQCSKTRLFTVITQHHLLVLTEYRTQTAVLKLNRLVFQSLSVVEEWLKETLHPQNRTLHRPVAIGRICRNVDFATVAKKIDFSIMNKYGNVSSGK